MSERIRFRILNWYFFCLFLISVGTFQNKCHAFKSIHFLVGCRFCCFGFVSANATGIQALVQTCTQKEGKYSLKILKCQRENTLQVIKNITSNHQNGMARFFLSFSVCVCVCRRNKKKTIMEKNKRFYASVRSFKSKSIIPFDRIYFRWQNQKWAETIYSFIKMICFKSINTFHLMETIR